MAERHKRFVLSKCDLGFYFSVRFFWQAIFQNFVGRMMATTISQGFAKLKSNLEITSLQSSTVSTRQSNVRDVVKAGLDTVDDFLTGSYRRSTMIAPLSSADVDTFFVLESKYYWDYEKNPAGLLDKVKGVLLKTYTRTPAISRNGQAVTITFDDFVVDVVPGFNREGGGYLIPNSNTSSWIATNPKTHVDIWSTANSKHSGNLIPLIKMIKCWNREHSQLLSSFHLECLVLKVLDGVTISSFPSGARYAFGKTKEQIDCINYDPAGFGGDVGQYLNTAQKRNDVKDRLDRAYSRALEAEQLEQQGKISAACDKWQMIFGGYFPAYG